MRFDNFHCSLGRTIQRAEREDRGDLNGRTLPVPHLKKKNPQQTKAAAASPYTLDALEINIKLKKSEDNPTTDHHLV